MKTEKIQLGEITIDFKTGLTNEQIVQQRKRYGSNLLTPPPRTPWWKQLLEKFKDPTIIILLASAFISLLMTAIEKYVLGNADVQFTESIGIFLAVFLAITVGYFSERKSEGEFDALNKVKDDIPVKVLRNGQITTTHIGDVVAGDLIVLDMGDKVPADGIMLDSMGLLIDQSLLTGESAPVRKSSAAFQVSSDGAAVVDVDSFTMSSDSSCVYRGTMVNDGHGLMLAVKVGDSTQMGKIAANLADDESKAVTPLVEKLSRLAKQISILGVSGALAIFTCMSLKALAQNNVAQKFVLHTEFEWILAGVSVVLGLILMRFVLRPFFASMDMSLKNWFTQFLASVPLAVASFAIGVSIWGFLNGFFIYTTRFMLSSVGYNAWGTCIASIDVSIALLQQVLTAFVVAVTIIVVAVPEGLPMMVTVSLAMNMLKMARQNCLVRKLVASETIGCATVICSDKTGTLTQNKMQPVWFWANGQSFSSADLSQLTATSVWKDLVNSVCINSEANLERFTDSVGKTAVKRIGNPTECALLAFFDELGTDYLAVRTSANRVGELGHNSQRKMSMVVVKEGAADALDSSALICHIKGAPERILEKCSFIRINGSDVPIDSYKSAIEKELAEASDRALRVLAIASKKTCGACFNPDNPETCLNCPGYVLLGLTGIEDPVRPEVPQAVERCQQAGVNVKMITGDAKPTAIAIAKQCGILSQDYVENTPDGELVLTTDELAAVTDDQIADVSKRLRVLSRSTPMDKLRLVKALHYQGEVVGMTGGGTNDAPALKFADVGLSMGVSGTEVAKEASDIVLIDDNFKSIVTGIWWGRTLYQNIQRFLQFQLSVNFVALTCALIGPLVGVSLPLTVTQLLWINIIMDTFAAIAYSTDPPREFSMHRKPVSRQAHIIMPSMWFSILCNSAFQVAMLGCVLYYGWFLEPGEQKFQFGCDLTDSAVVAQNLKALTVFFTTFIMFQFWHKFNCRALFHNENPFTLLRKNRLFIGVILVITIVQIVMVQFSDFYGIGQIFRTTSLSLRQWLEITGFTALILPVAWIVHQLAFLFGAER